jgi:hypothetical protein
MSLIDKLTQVDESLWKLHGKITEKSMKTIGWDKYDLAKASSNINAASCLSLGTYFVMEGMNNNFPFLGVMGGYFFVSSYFNRKKDLKYIELFKKLDEKDSIKGAAYAPNFTHRRPLLYMLSSIIPIDVLSRDSFDQTKLFIDLGLPAMIFSQNAFHYFLTQPPPPANKEPSLLDRLKEGVSDFIHKPKAVPIKYQLNDLSTYASQIGGLLG